MTLTKEQIKDKAISMIDGAVENNWKDAVVDCCNDGWALWSGTEVELNECKPEDLIGSVGAWIFDAAMETEENNRQYSPFEFFAYDMNALANDEECKYDPWEYYEECMGEYLNEWLDDNKVDILDRIKSCLEE